MTTTIRVSEHTRALISALARADGTTMQETVAQAVETYRRQRLLRETNAAYAAVRADPAKQADLDREIGEWDDTLADGLAGL
jgi:hypothetical protein